MDGTPSDRQPDDLSPTEPTSDVERRRALVVDDNALNADYIAAVLKKHPFDIDVADNGKDALQAVARNRPDVILLDIMMPGMSGMEVLDALRRDRVAQTIPIIMVTAKTQESTMLESYQTGADYFLAKPFTPRQLLHGIGLVLGIRLLDA